MDLERLSAQLDRLLLIVGGMALSLLVLLATGNVAMRLFGVPFPGTYEIVSWLGAVTIAAALGYTQRKKDHIVVDILSDRFPKPVKRLLDALNYMITAVLFGIIGWRVVLWGMNIQESGELSETLKLPFHGFVYLVGAGFASLALTLVVDFFRNLFGKEI